jgi:hypothetical protein
LSIETKAIVNNIVIPAKAGTIVNSKCKWDADYNSHSHATLRKSGSALNQRVQVQFIPETASYSYV